MMLCRATQSPLSLQVLVVALSSRVTLAIHILILFLVCCKNTFFGHIFLFLVCSQKKFCLSRSLTAVEKKMQILSASFEVLF